MNVQCLSSGKWLVRYDKMEFQSPLKATSTSQEEVVYCDPKTGHFVGRVYQKDDTWFLATTYFKYGQPIETMTKYEGFLLLHNLHQQNEY